MKFDAVPDMTWEQNPKKLRSVNTLDGVRLATTAETLQEIADLLYCSLLTPKILDELWLEAGRTGTQLESVTRTNVIVANSYIHDVHRALEKAIKAAGGDRGGFIEAVGKYWVLCNTLINGTDGRGAPYGIKQAVNYAWFTRSKGKGRGVTNTSNVWQTIGSRHNCEHWDPSQVIRLMHRIAQLCRAGSETWEDVDVCDIMLDNQLSYLISHEGPLKVTRMPCVPVPQATTLADGTVQLPEQLILG